MLFNKESIPHDTAIYSRIRLGWFTSMVMVLGLLVTNAHGADQSWRKVETEYFTVYSQTSEKETRGWAIRLEQFRLCMESLFPLQSERLDPVAVVIFKKEKDFHKYQPQITDDPYDVIGVFQRNLGRNIIMMVGDSDEQLMGQVVFHEATHWYFSGDSYDLPAWVGEGMAEVFAMFRMDGDQAVFGGSNPGRYHTLKNYGFLYIQNVMNMPSDYAHGAGGIRGGLFYAQSWLLMNYILADGQMGGFEAVKTYLEKTDKGMPYDVAFQEVFGMSYDELDEKLDDYFDREWFKSIRTWTDPEINLIKGSEAWATDDDVDLTLAMALLQQYRRDEALALVERVKHRSEDDPRVYEALAEIAADRGEYRLRDRQYIEAAKRGSKNYRVHFYAYRDAVSSYRYQEVVSINPNQDILRKAADSLHASLALNPSFRSGYELMAELLGSIEKPTEEDLKVVRRGMELYPMNPVFQVAIASYEIRHGKMKTAKGRLDRILAEDHDPAVTSYARRILIRLKAQVDLFWMRRAFQDRDTAKMYRFGEALVDAPLWPKERKEVDGMKIKLNQLLYIERAEKAMDENEWGMAEVLLEEVASEEISSELVDRYRAARQRFQKK